MMNRNGARLSHWRTPALILKFVVSPSGVSTTAEVFSYIICMAHEEPGTVSFCLLSQSLEID